MIYLEKGPVCICEDGYELYEDGSCLKPEYKIILEDGDCETLGSQWSNWLNNDLPEGLGDWETLDEVAIIFILF
jgi:hypothetical protein